MQIKITSRILITSYNSKDVHQVIKLLTRKLKVKLMSVFY